MKLPLLALVLGLQAAALVTTSVRHELALRQGTLILLDTQPVDPRDLLRGDFVILRYAIGDLPTDRFEPALDPDAPLRPGAKIWVELGPEPDGPFHRVIAASLAPREPAPGQVVLVGTVESGPNQTPRRSPAAVRVAYGLERYYVREGTGNPRGRLSVQVAVPGSGEGHIKEVFIDGIPYARAMREVQP